MKRGPKTNTKGLTNVYTNQNQPMTVTTYNLKQINFFLFYIRKKRPKVELGKIRKELKQYYTVLVGNKTVIKFGLWFQIPKTSVITDQIQRDETDHLVLDKIGTYSWLLTHRCRKIIKKRVQTPKKKRGVSEDVF